MISAAHRVIARGARASEMTTGIAVRGYGPSKQIKDVVQLLENVPI
jgi:hypothetical protein